MDVRKGNQQKTFIYNCNSFSYVWNGVCQLMWSRNVISGNVYNVFPDIHDFVFQGLKTGMYYLRTKPAASAIQFTVDKKMLKEAESLNTTVENMAAMKCSLDNPEECLMCGS